jgi:hypothetical protein
MTNYGLVRELTNARHSKTCGPPIRQAALLLLKVGPFGCEPLRA